MVVGCLAVSHPVDARRRSTALHYDRNVSRYSQIDVPCGSNIAPVEKHWCMTYLCLECRRPCLSGKLWKSFLILSSGRSSVIPIAPRANLVEATVLPCCIFLSAPLPPSRPGRVPEGGACLCISVCPTPNVRCAQKAEPTGVKP